MTLDETTCLTALFLVFHSVSAFCNAGFSTYFRQFDEIPEYFETLSP